MPSTDESTLDEVAPELVRQGDSEAHVGASAPPADPAPGHSSPLRSASRWSWPRLAVLGLVVLVLAVGFVRLGNLLPSFGNPFSSDTVDRSQPSLLQAIEDLSEYRAATGQFQVILDVEDDTRFVPSFIKGQRTVFLAGGTVDASVNFSGLGEGAIDVSEDGQAVTVHLPHARLSEPRIDPERSYVVNRQRGLLDRAGSAFSDSPTGERDLYLMAQEKLAAAAADAALVERAEGNTRSMLESMLGSLGFPQVTVTFDDGGGKAL